MKLKKEVKEGIIFIGVAAALILLVAIFSKTTGQAYEECLIENNNNVNFCHELIEG